MSVMEDLEAISIHMALIIKLGHFCRKLMSNVSGGHFNMKIMEFFKSYVLSGLRTSSQINTIGIASQLCFQVLLYDTDIFKICSKSAKLRGQKT